MTKTPEITPFHYGSIVRLVIIYIAWSFVAYRVGLILPAISVFLVIEVGVFFAFKKARETNDIFNKALVGWLNSGEWIFFLGAIGTAAVSPKHTSPLIALATFVTITSAVAQTTAMKQQKVSKKMAFGETQLPKNWRRNFTDICEKWFFAVLTGAGLVICIIAFVLDIGSYVPIGVSIAFSGLACAFSPQRRPLIYLRQTHSERR